MMTKQSGSLEMKWKLNQTSQNRRKAQTDHVYKKKKKKVWKMYLPFWIYILKKGISILL